VSASRNALDAAVEFDHNAPSVQREVSMSSAFIIKGNKWSLGGVGLGVSVLLALFAGCSTTTSDSAPTVDGGPSGNDAATNSIGSITLKADSFAVPAGGDITRCTAVRGTNATAMFTNRFTNTQAGHHVVLYAVSHPIDSGSFECPQGGQWNWNEIYTSTKHEDQYQLPADVGFKIEANQQFVIETHVINATDKEVQSASEVTLDFVDESAVKYPAAALFLGTTNIGVDAQANGSAGATCALPAGMHVARFFGHTHRRGTGLTVAKVTGGTPETPFYDMGAWDDPKVIPQVEFESGETVKVDCEYHNGDDKKVGYPDEMCLAGGFYWPANGTLACLAYANDPTCNCFQPINTALTGSGKQVTLNVSRAATIAGVKGDPAEGRPIYCYIYRSEDLAKDGPLKAKLAYWTATAQDAKPLATENDKITLTLQDVQPGEYQATCQMDTVYGGYFPGHGVPLVYPYVPVTVGETSPAPVDLKLNMANP
jgi:hypothetical protein